MYQHPLERLLIYTDKDIDARLYALYGLTEQEIRIIEGE